MPVHPFHDQAEQALEGATEDLDFTEIEVELVATHFDAANRTIISRDAATASAVLLKLKGTGYWHFAGHVSFSWDDARQSAIILSDNERLTVGNLLEMENLGRPRLVVLSACETGLYDAQNASDEFIGLPGAFMAVGAMGVLSTLWPVDDRATALFIARFYDALFCEGLTPPAALKHAQAWLRASSRNDLISFVRTANEEGRFRDTELAQHLEDSLSRGIPEDSRFSLIWTHVQNRQTAVSGQPHHTTSTAHDGKGAERLFAHPYFWGGFIYTGF